MRKSDGGICLAVCIQLVEILYRLVKCIQVTGSYVK